MKTILIITADYYPYPSSVTNCFEPFLQSLAKAGWDIDIVTRRIGNEVPLHEAKIGNRTIYRIDDPKTINTRKVNKLTTRFNNRFLQMLMKVWAFFSKSVFYMVFSFLRLEPRFGGWNKRKVLELCKKLNEQREYDIVMSVSYPVIAHQIAYNMIKTIEAPPKWIWIEFDPFSHLEYIYGKNSFKRLLPLQLEYYKSCDRIVTTNNLFSLYSNQDEFKQFLNKMTPLSYANMKEIYVNEKNAADINTPKNKINCVYAGALKQSVRNPSYAIRVFSKLYEKVHLTMMSGSRLGFIEGDLKEAEEAVTMYPPQTRDTAYLAMMRADILINIGNLVSFQTPGKIFEYMAMGKPIIHFSSIENDSCLEYFKNYPMVLIIKQYEKDIEQHRQEVLSFCKKYAGTTLPFSEVKKAMPELVSENITKEFMAVIDNVLTVAR